MSGAERTKSVLAEDPKRKIVAARQRNRGFET